ncbi:MAG: hypothetical protein JW863_12360 [Chitinispirillaceae bacterium]|nr:hypothetical protein [Chitinispirillaceae bacterium]
MKTETILKYLDFLANMAYEKWNDHPDCADLEQLQKEHNLFIERLKESGTIDRSFIAELTAIGDQCGMEGKPAGKSGLPLLQFIFPFGTGKLADKLSREAVKLHLDEYYHGIKELSLNIGKYFTL